MSVSVFVTVLGATVTVSVSAGAWAAPPPAPPDESCFSWWPPPEAAADVLVVVVVVVVVLVVVGAGVPVELQATDSIPTATAVTPTPRDARLRIRALINDNGFSLSSQSDYVTARYIPTGRQASANSAPDGRLRTACC
jgi:hypothetical protein